MTLPADWTLDAGTLECHCDALGDVRLITVDPLSAYLPGNTDSWKSQHVRKALEPVRRLAQARGIAVVLVQHLNRRGDTTDALARIADSQGIPALARSVLIWGASPGDPEGDDGTQKVLTRAKANLARAGAAASFRVTEVSIGGEIIVPKLVYDGEADVRADDVVSSESARTQTDAAMVFLRNYLAEGPREVETIKAAAVDADVSEKCLRTARERLCRSYRPAGNHGPYVWELRDKTLGIHGHTGASTDSRATEADARAPVDAHACPPGSDSSDSAHGDARRVRLLSGSDGKSAMASDIFALEPDQRESTPPAETEIAGDEAERFRALAESFEMRLHEDAFEVAL